MSTSRRDFPLVLKKDACETCGSKVLLQLDHWDNDRSNNNPTNARTLCWACHKVKTDIVREKRHSPVSGNRIFEKTVAGMVEWVGADRFRTQQTTKNQAEADRRRQLAEKNRPVELVMRRWECARHGRQSDDQWAAVDPPSFDWRITLPSMCPFCELPVRFAARGRRIEIWQSNSRGEWRRIRRVQDQPDFEWGNPGEWTAPLW